MVNDLKYAAVVAVTVLHEVYKFRDDSKEPILVTCARYTIEQRRDSLHQVVVFVLPGQLAIAHRSCASRRAPPSRLTLWGAPKQ